MRIAFGIARPGFCASPAVTAISSMHANEKIAMITAIHTPPKPCGNGPPDSNQLSMPVAGAPRPNTFARPNTMNATIAVTLIVDSQYSTLPKFATEREFT